MKSLKHFGSKPPFKPLPNPEDARAILEHPTWQQLVDAHRKKYTVKKIFKGEPVIHISGVTKSEADQYVESLVGGGYEAWSVSE